MIPTNKKIAILHPQLEKVWWAVKMMIFLANFLKSKWNEVEFFTPSYNEKVFSKDIDFKVTVLNKIKIAYKIRKFDYIIIWNSPMQFVWVLSKIIFQSKAKIFWWHHHFPWYYEKNKGFKILFKRYLEKVCVRFIDKLIWNSIYIQKSLVNIYKNKNKIEILNPVVDEEFQKYNKNKNKFSFDTKTIISYWRWEEWKNAKQIFDTFEFLENHNINPKLIVWWEGNELNKYKNKYKNKKNISFLWILNKDEIILNLEKSSVFLFPSKIDSFWISALEAMFIGVPVVAFNERGIVEIVQNKQNWLLASSSEDFSKKTFDILSDKKLNIKLSNFAIKTREKFSYSRFEEQLKNIFKE